MVSRQDWAQDINATISGSGWGANSPPANALIPQPQFAAISTGASATLTINLGASRSIGLIHVQGLITGSNGTIQVTAGSYNSGLVAAQAVPDDDEWAAMGRPRFFIPDNPVVASSVTLSLSAGTASKLAVGFVGVCDMLLSPINMIYGWSITVQDIADIQRVPYGSTWITQRGKVRRLNLGLDFLRQGGIYGTGSDQVFGPLGDALKAGKSTPVVAIPMPDDTANLELTSVWGLSTNDQAFANHLFATWNTVYQIDQLI